MAALPLTVLVNTDVPGSVLTRVHDISAKLTVVSWLVWSTVTRSSNVVDHASGIEGPQSAAQNSA